MRMLDHTGLAVGCILVPSTDHVADRRLARQQASLAVRAAREGDWGDRGGDDYRLRELLDSAGRSMVSVADVEAAATRLGW